MRSLYTVTVVAALIVNTGCSLFGVRSGYEQVNYTIIQEFNDVEIRQYKMRTAVEVAGASGRREAFLALFQYIDGSNSAEQSIPMTAPVELLEQAGAADAAEGAATAVKMRFFLPEVMDADSAPTPDSSRLVVRELPEQHIAAVRYSGSSGNNKFRKMEAKLLSQLEGSSWQPVGSVTFLGYDPPFTIPFLRRNEAVVPVSRR